MSQLELITAQTADVLEEFETLALEADALHSFDMAGKMRLAAKAQGKAMELAELQLAFMREVTAQLQHLGESS